MQHIGRRPNSAFVLKIHVQCRPIFIIIESYTEYNEKKKLKIQKYKLKMHKTHSHRQVNSVNYLELERTAVIQ